MLQIELSALSAQELKRLLEVARAREQISLAEQLVAELEARPTRAAEWRQTALPFGYMAEMEPEPGLVRPRRGAMAATAALAAFVSAAVTWGLSVPSTPRPQPSAAVVAGPAPRAAVVLASLAPVGAPPPLSEAAPAPGRAEPIVAPRPVRLAKTEPVARARANPCYDLPTPAERLVCGYPNLAAQDRQLRAAYDRALAAGADRRDVDRGQAVWRGESEQVADRKVLAERYTRRIRELDSAAVRPPPATKPQPEEPVF